jgi:hypothetical protein
MKRRLYVAALSFRTISPDYRGLRLSSALLTELVLKKRAI